MNSQERRNHVNKILQDKTNFRELSNTDFMKSTVENRNDFEAEDIYSSAGSKNILVVFTAGQSGTPLRQVFDFYLSKNIETGIYTISKESNDPLIEITYSEFDPTQPSAHNNYSYIAFKGILNLFVKTTTLKYDGSLEATFKDRNNNNLTSNGTFSFTL
ncbi:hypothetical protein ACIPIN_26390 [Pseudomonas sp. NPDC087697]|uniref:hypothetical protein n=1 Tax=Pseudomonas sp. NPDC087697 TaxID=3364447 RepID=UPI003812371C